MLEKRDKPLMTLDELFKLSGVEVTSSKDGKAHIFVEGVEVDETFNPFTDFYILPEDKQKEKEEKQR